MGDICFESDVAIFLQGETGAIELLNCSNEFIEFSVIGNKFKIVDYRKSIVKSANKMNSMENSVLEFAHFLHVFQKSSHVKVFKSDDDEYDYVAVLTDGNDGLDDSKHAFWIAVGIGEEIPLYDYEILSVFKSGEDSFSLASIYNRPQKENA